MAMLIAQESLFVHAHASVSFFGMETSTRVKLLHCEILS